MDRLTVWLIVDSLSTRLIKKLTHAFFLRCVYTSSREKACQQLLRRAFRISPYIRQQHLRYFVFCHKFVNSCWDEPSAFRHSPVGICNYFLIVKLLRYSVLFLLCPMQRPSRFSHRATFFAYAVRYYDTLSFAIGIRGSHLALTTSVRGRTRWRWRIGARYSAFFGHAAIVLNRKLIFILWHADIIVHRDISYRTFFNQF